jgi:hypothetical protein
MTQVHRRSWLAAGLLFLVSALAGERLRAQAATAPAAGAAAAPVSAPVPVSPWLGEKDDCAQAAALTLRHEGGSLLVLDGGRPVLAYNYGLRLEPGVDERYRRSSYVHPLYGPDGEVLTADFPADHRHHRGIYWAWPGVWLGTGERIDQWHLRGLWTGFESWLAQGTGRCHAQIGIRSGWFDASRRRVGDEIAWLRVRPFDGTGRAIDFDLTFAATVVPVTIQGQPDPPRGYGGFQYRPAAAPDIVITAEGRGHVQEKETDRVPARWVDYAAGFGAPKRSGVTIMAPFDHPGGAPGWTTRYYGFLGVAWPGLEKVTLEPGGAPLRLRYRVYVHRGDATEGRVAQAYAAYAAPGRSSR